MSNPGETNTVPIRKTEDLVAYLASGAKDKEAFAIGTEHEKFVLSQKDFSPVPYAGKNGIAALLTEFQKRAGGQPIIDQGNMIGLTLPGGASLSLEPGGQFELSGAPLPDLHQTKQEFDRHFRLCLEIGQELGLSFLPLGFQPTATREEISFMPKSRYKIMQAYMPKQGRRGLDMMLRTCTVQVNLDFADEADMVSKMRASLALQPLATALFASSPFYEGKYRGYLSERALVWSDTDKERTGIPQFIFAKGFGFARYTEWALSVPMYFVYRDGVYHEAAGCSFRDYMARKIPHLAHLTPTIGDFADHLTTLFPDVRLKKYLEMRGADAGSLEMMQALPAFWTGLLYSKTVLDEVRELLKGVSCETLAEVREKVPALGLNTPWEQGQTLGDLAREIVPLAVKGLKKRAVTNEQGQDESLYLQPLSEITEGKRLTQAEYWQARYEQEKSIQPVFREAILKNF